MTGSWKRCLSLANLLWLLALPSGAEELPVDRSRTRDVEAYKPQIRRYSLRHYGEDTWRLRPTCIVLHYTATADFPWNLVNTSSFAGEAPGLSVHYVVDGDRIWEVLPPHVRSRGAYGINHRALNIEMVALDAGDLARRARTLATCRELCRSLMERFGIPAEKIYSHQQVASMDPSLVPEVLDRVNDQPYGKIDPGEANLAAIKKGLER